jgi:hypothetical protein
MCMGVRIQVRRTRIARKAVDSKQARVSEWEREGCKTISVYYLHLQKIGTLGEVCCGDSDCNSHWKALLSRIAFVLYFLFLSAPRQWHVRHGYLLLSRTTSCFSRRLVLWRSAFFTPHLHFCLSAAHCRERKLLNARLTLDCLAGHAQTQPRWVEEMRWNTWGKLCMR